MVSSGNSRFDYAAGVGDKIAALDISANRARREAAMQVQQREDARIRGVDIGREMFTNLGAELGRRTSAIRDANYEGMSTTEKISSTLSGVFDMTQVVGPLYTPTLVGNATLMGAQSLGDATYGAARFLGLNDEAAELVNQAVSWSDGGIIGSAVDVFRRGQSIGDILFPKPQVMEQTGAGNNIYEGARQFINSRIMSLPGLAAAAGVSLATAEPLPLLAWIGAQAVGGGMVAGLQQYGQSYDQAANYGLPESDRRSVALGNAIPEWGFETVQDFIQLLPWGRLATAPAKATIRELLSTTGSAAVKSYLTNYMIEAPGEIATFALQNYVNSQYELPSIEFGSPEYLRQVMDIAEQTAVTSALFAGETHLTNIYANTNAKRVLAAPEPAGLSYEQSEEFKKNRLATARAVYDEFKKVDAIQAQSWMLYAITKINNGETVNIDLRNAELQKVIDTHRLDAAVMGSELEELRNGWNSIYRSLGGQRDLNDDEVGGLVDVAMKNNRNLQYSAMEVVNMANRDTNGSLDEYIQAGRQVRELMEQRRKAFEKPEVSDKIMFEQQKKIVTKIPNRRNEIDEILSKSQGQLETTRELSMNVAFRKLNDFLTNTPKVATVTLRYQKIGVDDKGIAKPLTLEDGTPAYTTETITLKLGKDGNYHGLKQYQGTSTMEVTDDQGNKKKIRALRNTDITLSKLDVYKNNVEEQVLAGLLTPTSIEELNKYAADNNIKINDPVEYLGMKGIDGWHDKISADDISRRSDVSPKGIMKPIWPGMQRFYSTGTTIAHAKDEANKGNYKPFAGKIESTITKPAVYIFDIDLKTMRIEDVEQREPAIYDEKKNRMETPVEAKEENEKRIDIQIENNPQASRDNEELIKRSNTPFFAASVFGKIRSFNWLDIFGAFQGSKRPIAYRVVASLVENVTPQKLASITKIVDWFGGSGGYGMSLALARRGKDRVLGKVTEVQINDWTGGGRMAKVRAIHDATEDEINQTLNVRKYGSRTFAQWLELIWQRNNEKDVHSRNVLFLRLKSLLKEDSKGFSEFVSEIDRNPLFRALVQLTIDNVESSRGFMTQDEHKSFTEDSKALVDNVYNYAIGMNKLAAYARSQGIKISYSDEDSFKAQGLFQEGSHILSVVDGPYYGTKGYDGKGNVNLETYMQTKNLLARIKGIGNNIVYNDSDWYNYDFDRKNEDCPDRNSKVDGRDAYDIWNLINNEMDMLGHFIKEDGTPMLFGSGRARGRGEAFGIYFGGELNGDIANQEQRDFPAPGVGTFTANSPGVQNPNGSAKGAVSITNRPMGTGVDGTGKAISSGLVLGKYRDVKDAVKLILTQRGIELFRDNTTQFIDKVFETIDANYFSSESLRALSIPETMVLLVDGKLFTFNIQEVKRDNFRLGFVYKSDTIDGKNYIVTPSQLKQFVVSMAKEYGIKVNDNFPAPDKNEILKSGTVEKYIEKFVKDKLESLTPEQKILWGKNKPLYSKETVAKWKIEAKEKWNMAMFNYKAELALHQSMLESYRQLSELKIDEIAKVLESVYRQQSLMKEIRELLDTGKLNGEIVHPDAQAFEINRRAMELAELQSRPFPIQAIPTIGEAPNLKSLNGMSVNGVVQSGTVPLLTGPTVADEKGVPKLSVSDEETYKWYANRSAYPALTGNGNVNVMLLPNFSEQDRLDYVTKVLPELVAESKRRGVIEQNYKLEDYFPEIIGNDFLLELFKIDNDRARAYLERLGEKAGKLYAFDQRFIEDQRGSIKIKMPDDWKKYWNWITLVHNLIMDAGDKGDVAAATTINNITDADCRRHAQDEEIRVLNNKVKKARNKGKIFELMNMMDRIEINMQQARQLFAKGEVTFNDYKELLPDSIKDKAQRLYDDIIKDKNDQEIIDIAIPRLRNIIRNTIIYEVANRHTGIGMKKDGNVLVDRNGKEHSEYETRSLIKQGKLIENELTPKVAYIIKSKDVNGRIKEHRVLVDARIVDNKFVPNESQTAMYLAEDQQKMINSLLPYAFWMPHVRKGTHWVNVYGVDEKGNVNRYMPIYSAMAEEQDAQEQKNILEAMIKNGDKPELKGAVVEVSKHERNTRLRHSMDMSEMVMALKDADIMFDKNGKITPEAEALLNQYRAMSPLLSKLIRSNNIPGYVGKQELIGRNVTTKDYDEMTDGFTDLAYSASAKMFRNEIIDTKITAQDIKDDTIKQQALIYLDNISRIKTENMIDKVGRTLKILGYNIALSNNLDFIIQNVMEPMWAYMMVPWNEIKNKKNIAPWVSGALEPEYQAMYDKAYKNGIIRPLFSESIMSKRSKMEDWFTRVSILSNWSDRFSSACIFGIGLRIARDKDLHGEDAYKYASRFLFGRGKPYYNDANVPVALNAYDLYGATRYMFMFQKFTYDWLSKFLFGGILRKLMMALAWVLISGPGSLPWIGRTLAEKMKPGIEMKPLRSLTTQDKWILGGVWGMMGKSSRFFLPLQATNMIQEYQSTRGLQNLTNSFMFNAFPQVNMMAQRGRRMIKFANNYSQITGNDWGTMAASQLPWGSIVGVRVDDIYRGQTRLKYGWVSRSSSGRPRVSYMPTDSNERFWTGLGTIPLGYEETVNRMKEGD